MLLTAGMFLSYPFLKGEIEDEEKNKKEAKVFTIGFSISIFMTLSDDSNAYLCNV